MPINYLLIFLWFSPFPTVSQEKGFVVDGNYDAKLLELSQHCRSTALYITDSIALNSESARVFIEAKIIAARLCERDGNFNKAINFALEGLKRSIESNHYFSQATFEVFLSKQFRILGYFFQGEKFLKRAEKTLSNLPIQHLKNRIKAELFLERSKYHLDRNEYLKAIRLLNNAKILFLDYDPHHEFQTKFLSEVEYYIGTSHFLMGEMDKAYFHYEQSLLYSERSHLNKEVGLARVYNGFGNLYLHKNDFESSERYFQKTREIADGIHSNFDQKIIYGNALDFYRCIGNKDSIALYSEKYIAALTSFHEEQLRMVNSEVWKQQEEIYAEKDPHLPYLLLGTLTVFGLFAFNNKSLLPRKFTIKDTSEENFKKTELIERDYINQETKDSILLKLEEFERNEKYLENDISFSLLATHLQTNPKYLRYIIKKYKGTDFATYINELRVTYIIGKMNTDPEYLKYKISYLAEEIGFSSHSRFTKTFKKLTHSTPSEYISKLTSQSKSFTVDR